MSMSHIDFGFTKDDILINNTDEQNDQNDQNDQNEADAEAAMFLDCRDADDILELSDSVEKSLNIEDNAVEKSLNIEDKAAEKLNDKITQKFYPLFDTNSIDFGDHLLAYIWDLLNENGIKEVFNSIYEFVINASPDILQLLLNSVSKPSEIAEAIHRLRVIVGVAPIDHYIEMQYYYIFTCCTNEEYGTDDWINIFKLKMDELVEEIFMGSVYLFSDNEINIVAFPSCLSEFETEFIKYNKVWGIRLKHNVLDDLNNFLKIEASLTDVGQELQFRILEQFMKNIAYKFPNLSKYKLGHMLHDNSYVIRFQWIRDEIDKFLPACLQKELDRQAELLIRQPFLRPEISLSSRIIVPHKG